MRITKIFEFLNEKIAFYVFLTFGIQLFFLFGIGICSFLTPDEKMYSRILDLIFTSQNLDLTFPTGGKSFIYLIYLLPAKTITLFGIDNIYAIRVNSALFHCLSIFFLKKILEQSVKKIDYLNLKIFLFSMIPSVFIFTSLGVRESFLIFLLTLFLLGLSTIEINKMSLGIFEITLSLFILLSFKYYLGLIILTTLFMTVFISRNEKFVSLKKLFVPMFLLVLYATFQFSQQWNGYFQKLPQASSTQASSTQASSTQASSTQASSTQIHLEFCLEKNQLGFLKRPVLNTLKLAKFLPADNYDGETALTGRVSDYVFFESNHKLISVSDFVPNVLIFLTAPILPLIFSSPLERFFYLDGLLFSLFFLITILILFQFLKARYVPKPLWVACICFTFIFVLFSGLTEVNLGTAIRHRTLLFPPALLMTLSAPALLRTKILRGNRNQ